MTLGESGWIEAILVETDINPLGRITDNHTCPLCKDDILAAMEATTSKKKTRKHRRSSSAASSGAAAASALPAATRAGEDSVAIAMEDTSLRHPSVQRVDSTHPEIAQASLLSVTLPAIEGGSLRSTTSTDSASSSAGLLPSSLAV